MPTRAEFEAREAATLASYAMPSRISRGRRHPEQEHPFRMAFQRDRDRIIHSTAFRRLEYKTQVFVNHEGDYYRTRLTHTMEAAQITRTLARALGLNEDLAEAVALAHDLGPHAVRPRRRTDARPSDGTARRLRAQRAEPAHRRRARGALSDVSRPEPQLGGARGHRQALDAVRPAPGARLRRRPSPRASRRRSSISPTRSPTTRTTSTTASSRGCSIRRSWRRFRSGQRSPPRWPGRPRHRRTSCATNACGGFSTGW